MQDTTVDVSEAPAGYSAELSSLLSVSVVMTGVVGLGGAAGLWLVDQGGFLRWVGWPVVAVAAFILWISLREIVSLFRDRGSRSVRRIESATRGAYVHLGRELSPFTSDRDQHLANSGRAHWRLILEDGSQWHLSKQQLKEVQFAKRARLWIAPHSAKVILVEVTEK